MTTKREQADAAYARQEDERALRLVADAAEMWLGAPWPGDPQEDDRPLRDELAVAIERVRVRYAVVNMSAEPERSVPGQINLLSGEIETCPKCGAPDPWAAMLPIPGRADRLQCRLCSHIVQVTQQVYEAVIARRRQQHSHTDTVKSPVVPEKIAKTRGAG